MRKRKNDEQERERERETSTMAAVKENAVKKRKNLLNNKKKNLIIVLRWPKKKDHGDWSVIEEGGASKRTWQITETRNQKERKKPVKLENSE